MYSPNTTYEGDNTVMLVQSSNFLRKLLVDLGKGEKISLALFEYLNKLPQLCKSKCSFTKVE